MIEKLRRPSGIFFCRRRRTAALKSCSIPNFPLSVPCLAGALLCVVKSTASSAEVPMVCAPEACGHTVHSRWRGRLRSFLFRSLPAPTPPARSFLFHFQHPPRRSFVLFSLPQPPRPFVRSFFTSRREVTGRRCMGR